MSSKVQSYPQSAEEEDDEIIDVGTEADQRYANLNMQIKLAPIVSDRSVIMPPPRWTIPKTKLAPTLASVNVCWEERLRARVEKLPNEPYERQKHLSNLLENLTRLL